MTRLLDRVPDDVRHWLADARVWAVVAGAGAVFAITWLYFVNGRLIREEATRKAIAAATASANYRQCVGSIPSLKKINTFLEGERDLVNVLVHNTLANVQSTPYTDPQYQTRIENLDRIVQARAKISAVVLLPVPTKLECMERRNNAP